MWQEFRAFIQRGNVVDLAVAVVVGGAFGQVTTSLVQHVIMPPLGLLIGGVDFSSLGIVLRHGSSYASVADAVAAGAPVLQIGAFLNTVVNFLIVSFAIFTVLRFYNRLLARFAPKPKVSPPVTPTLPPVPPDVALLTEIRDLLQRRLEPPATGPAE